MQASQRVRPMRREDVADVARLFFSVFRGRAASVGDEFRRYYERVFFDHPGYSPEMGGMVGLSRDGKVASALSALAIPFIACDRPVTGRLICAFVADPGQADNGAAPLSLALHPRHQEFSFTDTASDRSATLTRSVGAVVLPIHSMDWRISFHPLGARLERGPGERHRRLSAALATLVAPLDRLLRGRPPALPRGIAIAEIAPEAFAESVPAMVARFAIRPDFTAPMLTWLIERARENTAFGTLTLLAVTARGKTIGLVAAYLRRGRLARVLNVFTLPGREDDTVTAMCYAFRARGASGATGLAQPFLLTALAGQQGLRLKPRGFFCVSTRHADIREALARNDIYIGGLAGEGWSRLVSDWH